MWQMCSCVEIRPLAMNSRKVLSGLVLIGILLLVLAWHDGGEEPLREIVQPVALPGDIE